MPSLIPGFEYDIFISYRQKDNKGDRWVTEFVNALRTELEATFKEDVSVYFDENPHDGLLETHQVDKSLERKLKCLVFIPVLSQTYCDPKSFAWQHEFCAFNKLTAADRYGRDIRLANGNVASRILPVKIHELDAEDKTLLENELGGVLRSVEFIYRSAGVSRPLRANEDSPAKNLNETYYRDQVNKVAKGIKDIIRGLKSADTVAVPSEITRPVTTPKVRSKNKILFADMSPNHDQEYFSDGLSDELITVLSKDPRMKVIARTSSFSFKGKTDDVRPIGAKLGVAHLLEGSVQKSGNKLRIIAELVKVSDGSHVWSDTYTRDIDELFKVQDEIAEAVVTKLKMAMLGHVKTAATPGNTEVHNLLLQGKYVMARAEPGYKIKAMEKFQQALAIDSNDARVWAAMSGIYNAYAWMLDSTRQEMVRKAREAAERAIALDSNLAEGHEEMAEILFEFDWDWKASEAEFKKAISLNPDIYRISELYKTLGRLNEAVAINRMAVERDPVNAKTWRDLTLMLYYSCKLDEALAASRKIVDISPQYALAHYTIGNVYLLQGKFDEAIAEFEKGPDAFNEFKLSGLAIAYFAAGRKAESDFALQKLIAKHSNLKFYPSARAHAYRGEVDLAFECLEKVYTLRLPSIVHLKNDPWLKNLRGDPRHPALLRKMNLPAD